MQENDATKWMQLLQERETTSVHLMWQYMDRIVEVDQSGVQLNAVAEINPEAMAEAEVSDRIRETGHVTGLLHGIPIMIKDNIATADKMHTTAGTLALARSRPPFDAHIVSRLRQAGAIVLGKTNLTELANFMSDHMPNGYSARGGQVKNPYGDHFDPGGSSAGSGVAVAAGLVPLAVGTETSGSILSPASQNSIVGLKPSLGLVSRFGIIPIAHSQDTAGPMTTTVRDAALLLTVMVGPDPHDPITFTSPFAEGHNFTQYLVPGSLAGMRLGMAGGGYRDHWSESKRQVMMQVVQAFRDLNAEVVDAVSLPFPAQFSYDVLLFEFKVGIDAYLNQLGQDSPVHSLADIIQFNHRHADRALKYGQSILLAAESTRGTLTEPRYWLSRAQDIKWARTEGLDQAFDRDHLDAILFCGSDGADIAARAGYPSLTVPAGYDDQGQPVGMTLTGRRFSEPLLLRLGYAFEQYTKTRRAPNGDGRQ